MSFLATVAKHLTGHSEVTLKITAASNGALNVLVTSKLEKFNPDSDDPVESPLQAALARPQLLHVAPGDAPDDELAKLLDGFAQARAPLIDQLASYREGLTEAANQARIAANNKKKPATTGKPPSKSGATAPAAETAATDTDNGTTTPPSATTEATLADATDATARPVDAPAGEAAGSIFE